MLALIGLEVKKDAAIAKACAKSGDLLIFDVAKRGRVAWVAERFRQAGVKAETDACALLIEYVGEDDLHGLANEIVKIATWAQGEPVGVAEIEQLVSPVADVPPFVLTDAWADRHPGGCSTSPRRSSTAPTSRAATRLRGSRRRSNGHLTRMRQLKRLAAQGVPAREAATTLKMHPYYGEKVYRQAEAFSDEELAGATVRFAELDLAFKGGSRLAPDVELLRALIDVSAEPEDARRRAAAGQSGSGSLRGRRRDEARCLGLLAPGGVLVDRAVRRGLVDQPHEREVLGAIASASPAATAASSRFVSVLIVER